MSVKPTEKRARSQDVEEAFRTFYDANAPRVYALCLRLTGDAVKAGEATQDVFVRVWRTDHYEERGRVRGWLNRIAVNTVLDRARAARRRGWVPLEHVAEPSAHTPAPAEDRLTLERVIADLPDGARRVLVLHDVQGYRIREIADLEGVAEGTVKSQLHRARHLLQEALS